MSRIRQKIVALPLESWPPSAPRSSAAPPLPLQCAAVPPKHWPHPVWPPRSPSTNSRPAPLDWPRSDLYPSTPPTCSTTPATRVAPWKGRLKTSKARKSCSVRSATSYCPAPTTSTCRWRRCQPSYPPSASNAPPAFMPPPNKPHRLWGFPWPTFAGFATATAFPPPGSAGASNRRWPDMELTKPTKRQRRTLTPLARPSTPYRCTRPDWGNRIGWAVIVASTLYFAVRILPPLFFNW
jgi:hypothetical protein